MGQELEMLAGTMHGELPATAQPRRATTTGIRIASWKHSRKRDGQKYAEPVLDLLHGQTHWVQSKASWQMPNTQDAE